MANASSCVVVSKFGFEFDFGFGFKFGFEFEIGLALAQLGSIGNVFGADSS